MIHGGGRRWRGGGVLAMKGIGRRCGCRGGKFDEDAGLIWLGGMLDDTFLDPDDSGGRWERESFTKQSVRKQTVVSFLTGLT